MKKLKKFLISLSGAVVLSFSCISGSLSALAYVDGIATAVEAGLNTIAQAPYADDQAFTDEYYAYIHRQCAEGVVSGAVSDALGLTSVSIGSYTYVYGKYAYMYLDSNNQERQILCEVSMYYRDDVPTNIDQVSPYATLEDNSGRKYLANNIYWDIWRDDGTHTRYRYHSLDVLNFTQVFANTYTYGNTTGNLTNNGLTIDLKANASYFDCSDGSAIGIPVDWVSNSRDINLRYRDDNCIWVMYNFNPVTPPYHPTSVVKFARPGSTNYNLDEPPDESFVRQVFRWSATSGGSGSTGTSYPTYTLGFYETNSPDNKYIYETQMGSPKSNTYIYNYDNSYVGGTVVDNSNKNTIFDGTLNNCFDVDGNVILPFDFDADIAPRLNASLNTLEAKVNDFFIDMPDLGDLWTNRNTDNNYFNLPYTPPSPSPPSAHWESPTYPAVNTSAYIPADVPSYGTYAIQTAPATVITGSGKVMSLGWGLMDSLGFIALIIPLCILGIFWDLTGG